MLPATSSVGTGGCGVGGGGLVPVPGRGGEKALILSKHIFYTSTLPGQARGPAPPRIPLSLRMAKKLSSRDGHPIDHWNDLVCQHLERFDIGDVFQAEDDVVDADFCHAGEVVDDLGGTHGFVAAIASDIEMIVDGALDLLVGAANRFAVLAQHIQLAPYLIPTDLRVEVAGIGILRHQP